MSEDLTRRVDVRAVDRDGRQIPGVEFEWFIDDVPVGVASTHGQASLELRDRAAKIRVNAMYDDEERTVLLAPEQSSYVFQFDTVTRPAGMHLMLEHFPALVGIAFILIAVGLAFTFDDPSAFQQHLISSMFALGGGGFGGEIAGFIKTDLTLGDKLKIAAGGAVAIFVILFFYASAGASL